MELGKVPVGRLVRIHRQGIGWVYAMIVGTDGAPIRYEGANRDMCSILIDVETGILFTETNTTKAQTYPKAALYLEGVNE